MLNIGQTKSSEVTFTLYILPAMMIPADIIQNLQKRLRSIQGQVGGLTKMLNRGDDPVQILMQFKAAQKALGKAHELLLDEVFRKVLALKIVQTVDSCPGNCGQEEKIEKLLQEFPNLSTEDVTGKLKEVALLEDYLRKLSGD